MGFALLPSSKSLLPTQFWDWAPYLGLLAALVAGLASADGVLRGERWLSMLLVSALTAWLIVPTWDELTPSRPIQIALLAAGMFVLAISLEPLAKRIHHCAYAFWLMLSAATVSLIVMAEVSETLGTLAALPAGALTGCGLAAFIPKDSPGTNNLSLPYAIVVGTYAYAGFIYPSPPLALILCVPLVPLALWLATCGPLAHLTGVRALAAQAACIVLPLAVIAAVVLLPSGSE